MDILEKNGEIIVKDIKDFYPKHIFECGQCFRWDLQEDGSYTGVVFDKVINVSMRGKDAVFKNTNISDFENLWIDYFDLNKDYTAIKDNLSKIDNYLKESVNFGHGIRMLKQPFEEMVISFIISARNSIPMIKRSVAKLSELYGEHIDTLNGVKYYSFPSVIALSEADEEIVKEAKVAFRSSYIINSAKMLIEKNINKDTFKDKNLEDTVSILKTLNGVGPKVADCIALFGLQKYDSFPVDVWVKRVIEEFYLKDKNMSLPKIRQYCLDKFGDVGGYAQQYLFYYARENSIGTAKKK